MKNILKNVLAGLFFVVFTITAIAVEKSKGDILKEQISNEVLQEAKIAGCPLAAEELAKIMVVKLRERLDEYKEIVKEDCIKINGEDNDSLCQCFSDKLDYDAQFSILAKLFSGSSVEDTRKSLQAIKDIGNEAYKACGRILADAVPAAASEKQKP